MVNASVMFVAAKQFIPPRSGDGEANKIYFISVANLLAEIIRIPICVCVFTKCRNQGCAGAKLNRNIQQDKTSDIIIERVVCCCPIFHDRPDIVLCIVSSVFIILISICIALNGQALKSKL